MKRLSALSLHARLSLLLVGVLTVMALLAGGLWLRETRNAIHEEMQSANHVAGQWLQVLIDQDAAAEPARLLATLSALGRIRAHALQLSAEGELRYVSPASTYKAGQVAPRWFAAQLEPALPLRHFHAGGFDIELRADSSRAVLDAWDDGRELLLGAVLAIVLIGLACHAGLRRALAPLHALDLALSRAGRPQGRQRLPSVGALELDRLADGYNHLAARLDDSLANNALLQAEQRLSRLVADELEAERQLIARELHDELAQSITAVRTMAAVMLRRSAEPSAIHANAQVILAMSAQLQEGVSSILQRLRQPPAAAPRAVQEVLEVVCVRWSALYPQIRLQRSFAADLPVLAADGVHALEKIVQEALTNIARHAQASAAVVELHCSGGQLSLRISDDGRGPGGGSASGADRAAGLLRPRYGLLGMTERVAALGGQLHFGAGADGGCVLEVSLPLAAEAAPARQHAAIEEVEG